MVARGLCNPNTSDVCVDRVIHGAIGQSPADLLEFAVHLNDALETISCPQKITA